MRRSTKPSKRPRTTVLTARELAAVGGGENGTIHVNGGGSGPVPLENANDSRWPQPVSVVRGPNDSA